MARTTNLIRRNGRWYFNKAYPKELWSTLGRSPFRMSLGTDSLEAAQRSRLDAERLYWARVDAARTRHAEVKPRILTEPEAMVLVSRWFVERNQELDDDHLHDPTPVEIYTETVENSQYALSMVSRLLGQGDVYSHDKLAQSILADEGVTADPDSRAYRTFLQLLVRANKELTLLDLARLKGDFGYRPSDPVFAAALENSPSADASKRTLADLIKEYREDQEDGWSPSTKASYQPVFRLLKGILGDSRDVSTLTRDDGRAIFNAVKALPRNLGKLKELKGLAVPEAIKKAKALGLPTLSPKSINDSYMAFIKAIFGWAVNEEWMAKSPVSGLSVEDEVHDADKRDPFTVDQLKVIFGSAPWQPRDEALGGQPLRFWAPLLALFLGMRRGEIAQLNVADVQTINGVPVILIRAGGGKRTKTKNARRMLPVHPELKRLGFLLFVAKQHRAGHTQLFPGEQPNTNGQWGDGLSDWFTRLLAKHKLTGTRLGMHSLRHNFEDALREAELHGTAIGQELAGRTKGGDVSSNYGSGFSTKRLEREIAKISYPDLDLSTLHAPG